jgi:ADP-ribose pyrophosphatase YjhB (NUDIX family)
MTERPLNIVAGTLVKDGKCLLIRRIKDPYKNYWSLPGGKLELGEDIAEAIERELKEETGLTVKFTGLRGIVSEVLRDHKTNKVSGHFLIWVSGLRHIAGEAAEQNEGKVQWFDAEELEKQKHSVIPSDYLMVKRFAFSDSSVSNFHTVYMRSTDDGYSIEHTDL